jgi:hypothetical protein
MGRQHVFSNIHQEDKIHTIQPEELPNIKQTDNHYLDNWRADRVSETTPHSIDSRMTGNEHILYTKAKTGKNNESH